MKKLLPLLLLCACAGSLVDHAGAQLSGGDGGTQACLATCTQTDVPGATPRCEGDVCTYECPAGKLKAAGGCHEASEISGGASHTCAVVGGEARCWGANDKGQLGRDIPAAGSFVPGAPSALTGIVSHVAAGAGHSCAIVDGNVWCWGDNASGQLGNGTVGAATGGATPHQVANIAGAVLLAAGGAHTCAATATRTYCWGNNNLGQLGDGADIPETPRPEATEVPGAAGALALGAGDSHTCAVIGSGVLCWGANGAGQLGNNTAVAALSTPGPTSPALSGASFLGLGLNHGCAGVGDALSCWGANGAGQINSSLQDQRSPKGVLSGVLAVVGGTGHTCAITKDQALRCWGLDGSGQLGAPGQTDVRLNLTAVGVAGAGARHTCATANSETYCWGANDRGQLGADPAVTTASTATPIRVSGR